MKVLLNIWILIGALLASLLFTSCDDDDDLSGSTPIVVNAIYLQNAQSTVPDREVEFIRLGQVMRIEGSGFTGLRRVYINGYNTYFNPVYVTDNSMLIQVGRNTPTSDADENVRNTIRFLKTGVEKIHQFEIRAAAPTITSISHTLPKAGETITIYGTGLVEIERVVFPGNVVVTEGIIDDEDGKFVTVTVPAGLTEGGTILVEGANGGAYSPAYFNYRKGVILDFDGTGQQGFWGWSETGSMINADDLESAAVGTGNVSQGNYVPHRPSRLAQFGPAANRRSEVWTAGNDVDDWRRDLASHIDPATPVSQVAFQFDIFVPEVWVNTGYLKILLFNSYNGGEWSGNVYNYVPWIDGKEVVPFQTEGWVTVTVPFNKFYAFSAADGNFTFEDVLVAREGAQWKNFGIFFENSDFKLSDVTRNNSDTQEFASSATSVRVYTDNWRVVPLETPEFSDFPEDEE